MRIVKIVICMESLQYFKRKAPQLWWPNLFVKRMRKMRIKFIAYCIVHHILILCIIAVVLISGCSSTSTEYPPSLITPTTPAITLPATTSPTLTPGGACRQGLTWCNGHCSDLSAAIGDCGTCGNACPSGQSCMEGQCCTKGLALCSGICSDLTADVNNCGTCGNGCPDGSICHNSHCLDLSIECPPGQEVCFDERCHDLTSDNMNCGACGNVCPAYSGCTNSVCVAMEGEGILNYVINMPV